MKPSPALFANKKRPVPSPQQRPVKRKPGLSSHVDEETLAKLRALKGRTK
ncbi:hypothetical protein [Leucobacter sp. GX24907]